MAAVTVTTSATAILDGTTGENPHNRGGQVLIFNNGSNAVFLGADSGVTTSTGISLGSGETLGVELGAGRAIYGIVASGTEEVRVEVF